LRTPGPPPRRIEIVEFAAHCRPAYRLAVVCRA
jgi:hypothetical protein